jgi:hypothetical protein
MAKKKTVPARQPDQHKSGFMVRLPEEGRAMLDRLKAAGQRPFTTEVMIALRKHYRDTFPDRPGTST